MKKKSILISSIFLFCLAFQLFAQGSPAETYQYRHDLHGDIEVTFTDGAIITVESVAKGYNETDGWAYIKGYGKIHYWLYDTYKNFGGRIAGLYNRILPEWAEAMGYVIDFDQFRDISPDQNVPSSVKSLMKQRFSDVAAALITSDTSYPYGKSPCLVIHCYDKSKDNYWTLIYPLY